MFVVLYCGQKRYSMVIPEDWEPKNSRIHCSIWPVTITRRLKPFLAKELTNRPRIGIPLTSVRHLGMFLVTGYRRLPVPAARSKAVVIGDAGMFFLRSLCNRAFFLATGQLHSTSNAQLTLPVKVEPLATLPSKRDGTFHTLTFGKVGLNSTI